MLERKNYLLAALTAGLLLSACGGSDTDRGASAKQLQGGRAQAQVQAAAPADYADVVQKIYLAYFGRPADAGGLTYFEGLLQHTGVPADLVAINQAYPGNAELQSVINVFSVSQESAALYAGDTQAFVTAIYRNVLNRDPDAGGLAYWSNLVDTGAMTKANAALSILASALGDTSVAGKPQVDLINARATTSAYFTTALAASPDNLYTTMEKTALARLMLSAVTSSTDVTAYRSIVDAYLAELIPHNTGPLPPPDKPYPLMLAYAGFLAQGMTEIGQISGTCGGGYRTTLDRPVTATFEGAASYAVNDATTMNLTGCSPATFSTTTIHYFNTNYAPLGSADPGLEYTRILNPVPALPLRVGVGDSGNYGTQTLYTDSSKATITGRRELTYTIEADAGSTTPASAIFNLAARTYDNNSVLTQTLQARYRLRTDGTVTHLSDDVQYAGTSTVHLVRKVQPSALTKTDTVVGTGTAAVNGMTLTVNYTGWLYDAGVANTRGAQFDSSVGRGPFSFKLGAGAVIAGFDQGLLGMKVGGKRTLTIPYTLGYGTSGAGASIPPYSALIFDIELVSVK
jgi:FKBP-type peptidyl-prolyl cis-trans isomerase